MLRRVIGKDGKSRAFINDQPISIGLLKQFGERLLEIHGQFETHGLLNPASHRGLLDAFAGCSALKDKTATASRLGKRLKKNSASPRRTRTRAGRGRFSARRRATKSKSSRPKRARPISWPHAAPDCSTAKRSSMRCRPPSRPERQKGAAANSRRPGKPSYVSRIRRRGSTIAGRHRPRGA